MSKYVSLDKRSKKAQKEYQERSEQIKLRSYFEKQHQDIELRKKLALVK